MTFLSPLWLLALAPWLVVAVMLLRKRRRPTHIPFLELWRGPVAMPKPQRRFDVPPWPLALMMLAMLLAILAAAGPALRGGGGDAVTVIVDRGATMSVGRPPRYVRGLERLGGELSIRDPGRPVKLIFVPGVEASETSAGWLTRAHNVKATAADTAAELRSVVSRELGATRGAVVVLSDQDLPPAERQIHLRIGSSVINVGIARVAARDEPKPQVMVTVRGDRDAKATKLTIKTLDHAREIIVDPAPEPREHFVDLPALGPWIEARLDGQDDAPVDDAAYLAREGRRPRVEARAAVPAAVDRVIATYAALHPPSEGSPHVRVVNTVDAVGEAPAIVVDGGAPRPGGGDTVTTSGHPITSNADFAPLATAPARGSAPAGWSAVVTRGDEVLVAVREQPARQVWVGVDVTEWARTPGFVVFWANAVAWVSPESPAYAGHPVGSLGPEWKRVESGPEATAWSERLWPGVYRRDDGAMRAINSEAARPATSAATDAGWPAKLEALRKGGGRPLSPCLLIGAIACVGLAAAGWKANP